MCVVKLISVILKRILYKETIKFILVGVLNTIFYYLLFALFVYWGLYYSYAALFATIIGVLFNFQTIGKLVFNSHDTRLIWRFIFAYIILYLINIGFLEVIVYTNLMDTYYAGAVLAVLIAPLSYIFNKYFVFTRH